MLGADQLALRLQPRVLLAEPGVGGLQLFVCFLALCEFVGERIVGALAAHSLGHRRGVTLFCFGQLGSEIGKLCFECCCTRSRPCGLSISLLLQRTRLQ